MFICPRSQRQLLQNDRVEGWPQVLELRHQTPRWKKFRLTAIAQQMPRSCTMNMGSGMVTKMMMKVWLRGNCKVVLPRTIRAVAPTSLLNAFVGYSANMRHQRRHRLVEVDGEDLPET
mmetsp:Transcript_15515/g.22747  ORF Transcript_15515/g.22747 Transcript_15515/m.22747 type:complete len:118 (+) Transcript_15515:1143-1496(+)